MADKEDDGSLQLEAMRRDDHSWHPCQVSLSSGGSSLIVDFESCNWRQTIFTREEALSNLRIRSIPLKDGECFHIKEGEHILAMHKEALKSPFFDAEVDKICRVRHSARVYCRCTFSIKWLHPEMKGDTMNIPSNSVKRLAKGSIHSHPTVAAFFGSSSPFCSSDETFSINLLDDIDCKIGIQKLLEEQIKEIGKVVDAPSRVPSDEILLGVEVEHGGHALRKAFVASEMTSLNDETPSCKNTRKSTMNRRKLDPEHKSKDHVPSFQPSFCEHSQKRSFLSPLAARAALASLMHESPQTPNISPHHVKKEGDAHTSQGTPRNHENLVADMCTSDLNPHESYSLLNGRSGSVDREASYDCIDLQENSRTNPKILEDGSLTATSATTRFTRSDLKKKPTNAAIPSSRKRLTRSSAEKEIGYSVNEAHTLPSTNDCEPSSHTMTASTAPANSKIAEESFKCYEPQSASVSVNSSSLISARRLTRSVIPKVGCSIDEISLGPSNKDREPIEPSVKTRITRSANQKVHNSVNEFKAGSLGENGGFNDAVMSDLEFSIVQTDIGDQVYEGMSKSRIKARKASNPLINTRSTRSASKKELENSVEELEIYGELSRSDVSRSIEVGYPGNNVQLESLTGERKLSSSTTRRTRSRNSVIDGKTGTAVDLKNIDSGELKSCSPSTAKKANHSLVHGEMGCSVSKNKSTTEAEDMKSQNPSITKKITRLEAQKEVEPSIEVDMHSSNKDQEFNTHSIPPRLTRSAVQKQFSNLTSGIETEKKKGEFSQDPLMVDLTEISTPNNKEPKKKLPALVSSNSDRNACQQKRKMFEAPHTIIDVDEGEESEQNKATISTRSEGHKTKKPQMRFSPRLRLSSVK